MNMGIRMMGTLSKTLRVKYKNGRHQVQVQSLKYLQGSHAACLDRLRWPRGQNLVNGTISREADVNATWGTTGSVVAAQMGSSSSPHPFTTTAKGDWMQETEALRYCPHLDPSKLQSLVGLDSRTRLLRFRFCACHLLMG
jgi:hypothetical protein